MRASGRWKMTYLAASGSGSLDWTRLGLRGRSAGLRLAQLEQEAAPRSRRRRLSASLPLPSLPGQAFGLWTPQGMPWPMEIVE